MGIGEVGTAIEVFSGQETTMTPSTAQQADPRVAELKTTAADADRGIAYETAIHTDATMDQQHAKR